MTTPDPSRELTGERAERVKARLKEDSPESYEYLDSQEGCAYVYPDDGRTCGLASYRAQHRSIELGPPRHEFVFPGERNPSLHELATETVERLRLLTREPAPTPPDQELRERVRESLNMALYLAFMHGRSVETAETEATMRKAEDAKDAEVEKAVDAIVQLIEGERRPLQQIIDSVEAGMLSHTLGGDPGMIFDSFDAEVERKRAGFWTVDDAAMKPLQDHQRAIRKSRDA